MNNKSSKDALVVFQDKNIRRVWYNYEWWFVIKDVVIVLTESINPSDYLKKLRKRDPSLSNAFQGGGQIDTPLGLEFDTAGGRQMLQCWNTKGMLRLIQSIPSKKAEPFKQWLAQVGYERVQEIENPELAQERMIKLYEQKGYSKSWIDKRIRGIAIRQDLTEEWIKRGIEKQKDFSILTAEISNATFGMTPNEYKKFKNINNENLRDHMTDLELIFTMLGEASTTEIEKTKNPKTFNQHKKASKDGGTIAKNARLELEEKTNKTVLSNKNYLNVSENEKRKKIK